MIILLGPPGAGKGTQAKKLKAAFQLKHIATGDILRQEVQRGSELGKTAGKLMDAGELVPDELVAEIVRNCLEGLPEGQGIILDGFPRNVWQAEFLDRILDGQNVHVINIKVDEREVLKRLSGRRYCKECGKIHHVSVPPSHSLDRCDACGSALVQRKDDREEVVSERLNVYWAQTYPLVNYYSSRNTYHEVDGNREVSRVFESISKIVDTIGHDRV